MAPAASKFTGNFATGSSIHGLSNKVFEKIFRARENSQASIEPEGIPESTRPSLRVRIVWHLFVYTLHHRFNIDEEHNRISQIDAQAFPSIDWDDPIQTAVYFLLLFGPSRIARELGSDKTDKLTNLVLGFTMCSGEDDKAREALKRTIFDFDLLPVEVHGALNRDTFIPSVESARKRMHETMKRAAHEVHDLLIPFHRWQYDNPGDDFWRGDEVYWVLLKACDELTDIVLEDSHMILWLMPIIEQLGSILTKVNQVGCRVKEGGAPF
ncbi:hypothetical protein BT96DRAFT_978901 [Gymnopus androsaceus JB14]|uniref:Uncharacterized protein n=1 Tax=Gymnopus androsaceus JB14 TaxID=1447944 RepID=A0A6A4H6U3_9AGAR|nr:hypothetical protein BT96DRAFT_978901 [Gymnopus androsaceus JB14]